MRALSIVMLVACSTPQVPSVRFADAPPVTVVDDRRDVRVPPQKRTGWQLLWEYDGTFHRRITRALELPAPRRARGVNALDEVPDSTWFTNRIGVRALTPDEIRTGAATSGNPEAYLPWTIHSTKVSGAAVGFVIEDSRGIKFILKFEQKGYPELESATDAIVSRILWAAGYHVPEDYVVYVDPNALVLAPDATIEDIFGTKRRLDRVELGKRLALCEIDADGRMRALASRFLDGKLLGGHPSEGRRTDDPNDRIPHELRRDLRGAYTLFSWLDHIDVKETNTLDVWERDPADGRHYVKHYFLDFGKSFGVMATMGRDMRRGYAYRIDFREMFRSFVSAGLVDRAWEHRGAPVIRGVGLFDVASYNPGAWKAATPGYAPFLAADDRDKLWGAKLAIRFTREQLAAAVDAGRLTDPRAAAYLLETLVARQRITARHWFAKASPLDRFTVDGDRLCFDDLAVVYELADAPRYLVARYDGAGRAIASRFVLQPGAGGHTCMPLGRARDGYTIIAIAIEHGPKIFVHVAGDVPRVIGVWRP